MRIRHSFSRDWDGDPAIYFRIVFTDDSVKRYPLSELTHRLEDALIEDLALFTSEYPVYKRPSMGIAADLLELAARLADPAPGELEQTSFRRSISTAYYGLFHLLVQDAVRAGMLQRRFDHRTMKEVSNAVLRSSWRGWSADPRPSRH